jgi:hypothetical protein
MTVDWVQWLAVTGGLAAAAGYLSGRRDRVRADAAMVYVVVTTFDLDEDSAEAATTFRVVNGSSLPVFRVIVSPYHWGFRRASWRLRRSRNWMTGVPSGDRQFFPTVPPNESTDEVTIPGLPRKGARTAEIPPLVTFFRDGHGRVWIRWPSGRLTNARMSAYYVQGRLRRSAVIAKVTRR